VIIAIPATWSGEGGPRPAGAGRGRFDDHHLDVLGKECLVKAEKYRFVILALLVPLAAFSLLTAWPLIQAIAYSFTDWEAYNPEVNFTGLENYQRMMNDQVFWRALQNNVYLVALAPLITVVIALFLAAMLNTGGASKVGGVRPAFGAEFYRVVYFFPQVLSIAVLAVMFQNIFNPRNGLLNAVLGAFGIRDFPGWLSDSKWALTSVMLVLVWAGVGFYVVILNAAMAGVDPGLYEAALLDGASPSRQFLYITLPSIRDTVIVCWIYAFIIALDGFALVQILTIGPGGPDYSTMVLGYYVYSLAFSESKYGYASAIGVVLAIITIAFSVFTSLITRERDKEARARKKAAKAAKRALASSGKEVAA